MKKKKKPTYNDYEKTITDIDDKLIQREPTNIPEIRFNLLKEIAHCCNCKYENQSMFSGACRFCRLPDNLADMFNLMNGYIQFNFKPKDAFKTHFLEIIKDTNFEKIINGEIK